MTKTKYERNVMSLADKLVEASKAPNRRVSLCKIGSIVHGTKLSEDDRTTLKDMLDTPEGVPNRLSNSAIGRVLREEGFDTSNSAVDRHRRSECGCNRKISE
jgi:hypothetical protein